MFIDRFKMMPSEMFTEDLISVLMRYGLYVAAAFQLMCLLACVTLSDESTEPVPYEQMVYIYSDSDDCSSENSSPEHTWLLPRRQDRLKKRR